MLEKEKIALLWLIRQRPQGVSAYALMDMIKAYNGGFLDLPVALGVFEYTTSLERGIQRHVEELLALGLLTTPDKAPFSFDAKLSVTPLLGRIQDIFQISLTESLKRTDAALTVEPLFGKPMARVGSQPWPRLFVAMPFRDDLRPVFDDHILKVAAALGVTCARGDHFSTTNSIMQEIYSAIVHADLLIADCTGKNANVFYELGMAHMLGKRAILIAQSRDDFPFDVAHLRSILYATTPPGMAQFETLLEKTIRTELSL
ncbi:MAG: hypothetical protein JNL42_20020 [Anaerolineae bacterium]|nr:hypothetical protein [Anaerolineae bacterium]